MIVCWRHQPLPEAPVPAVGRARVAERSVGPGLRARAGKIDRKLSLLGLPFQLGFSCFFLRTVFSSFPEIPVQLSSSLAEQNTGITTTGLASFSNLLLGWKGADRPAARVN